MQLLGDVVRLGLAKDGLLWREWEQASRGRRSITWSSGFRAKLLPDAELTDEQLAEETDHGGEPVVVLSAKTWAKVVAHPVAATRLLDLVEKAGSEDAHWIVERWLRYANLPPARNARSVAWERERLVT
jgi:hypothetical protein